MIKRAITLLHLRRIAARNQGGRCCYCKQPIWDRKPGAFLRRYGISLDQVQQYRCTAEHLTPRCEGGKDRPGNIAAACLRCNSERHHASEPLPAALYEAYVHAQIMSGQRSRLVDLDDGPSARSSVRFRPKADIRSVGLTRAVLLQRTPRNRCSARRCNRSGLCT